MMRWAGHVARFGKRVISQILVGKPEGKRPLRKPRRKWMYSNKINLREAGGGGGLLTGLV
jgi:hypothetical protein